MAKKKLTKSKPPTEARLAPSGGSATWTLTDIDNLTMPLEHLGSGACLVAATHLARKLTRADLEKLTDRCITEERCWQNA